MLCQALDLRALQVDLRESLSALLHELLPKHFIASATSLSTSQKDLLITQLERSVHRALDATSSADCSARMQAVAAATSTPLVDFFSTDPALASDFARISSFRAEFAERAADALATLRRQYLEGACGPTPASKYLGKTKAVYEFVRLTLGVRMHGAENLHGFAPGPGIEEVSIGQNISLIHEAIRDGKMQGIVVELMKEIRSKA